MEDTTKEKRTKLVQAVLTPSEASKVEKKYKEKALNVKGKYSKSDFVREVLLKDLEGDK